MNENRNEADRILGEDWMMPGYRRFPEAWEKHPQRELLDERKGEVGETGASRWGAVRELHEDGWVECWQRPTDLRDGRESICIGRVAREGRDGRARRRAGDRRRARHAPVAESPDGRATVRRSTDRAASRDRVDLLVVAGGAA